MESDIVVSDIVSGSVGNVVRLVGFERAVSDNWDGIVEKLVGFDMVVSGSDDIVEKLLGFEITVSDEWFETVEKSLVCEIVVSVGLDEIVGKSAWYVIIVSSSDGNEV